MDALSEFARDFLVSIHPDYATKILRGEKTVELRRKFPEVRAAGGTVLIYSTSPVRAVVGYARIKHVVKLPLAKIWKEYGAAACISKEDFYRYFSGVKHGFAILLGEVSSLKKHVKASDLLSQYGIVAPQSYRYVGSGCVASLSDERFQTPNRHERRNRTRGRQTRSSLAGGISPS